MSIFDSRVARERQHHKFPDAARIFRDNRGDGTFSASIPAEKQGAQSAREDCKGNGSFDTRNRRTNTRQEENFRRAVALLTNHMPNLRLRNHFTRSLFQNEDAFGSEQPW